MEGILLVKKEKGYTSHDVVSIVKKVLKEKVGHTGTLDPNATGVLPLLIGKGTKLAKYLVNHDKTYIATLKLGIKTDTADGEGNVIEERNIEKETIKKEKIEEALQSFVGEGKQIPPMYSAIKINGKKLYEYARKGKEVQVEPRNIKIYSIQLNEIRKKEAEIVYTVECSKGTYIRTLCEDIATTLNTIGYMKELERIRVGEFDIEQCISVDKIKEEIDTINRKIITIEQFFMTKQRIVLEGQKLEQFLNGVKLVEELADDYYRIYDSKDKFIGIGVIAEKKLKRELIL